MDGSKFSGKKESARNEDKKVKRFSRVKNAKASSRRNMKRDGAGKNKFQNGENVNRKFNGERQVWKFVSNKRLTSGRLKPKQTQEGMFLKGLRTNFVRRESLNEANEARKNEDVNKIIDLGRAIGGKRCRIDRKCLKSKDQGVKTFRAAKSIYNENDLTSEKIEDFESCTLSPISSTFDADVSPNNNSSKLIGMYKINEEEKKVRKHQINFHEEFKNFASQLEEIVSSEMLSRLPKNEILGSAMKSLRDLCIGEISGMKKENLRENEDDLQSRQFLSGYELILQHTQPSMPNSICNTDSLSGQNELMNPQHDSTFFGITPKRGFESIAKTSVDFCNDSPEKGEDALNLFFTDSEPENKTTEKSTKELDFITPPIQFYRRNMF